MYPWWYIKIALKSPFRFIKWPSVRNYRCKTFHHGGMLFGIPPLFRLFSTIPELIVKNLNFSYQFLGVTIVSVPKTFKF